MDQFLNAGDSPGSLKVFTVMFWLILVNGIHGYYLYFMLGRPVPAA